MIVDQIWKLTNEVRARLAPRSSHSESQATLPDKPHEGFRVWGLGCLGFRV